MYASFLWMAFTSLWERDTEYVQHLLLGSFSVPCFYFYLVPHGEELGEKKAAERETAQSEDIIYMVYTQISR